jgi:CheY-like chemotaxis protein
MKKRILVLDDEIDFARLMKVTLEGPGKYEVRSAIRSTTFLQVAKDFKPDLILLDCMMPGMDGGEIAGQIQTDPDLKETPFMFLTATADELEARESQCYKGAQVYIPKTMELDEIFKLIENRLAVPPAPAST